MYLRKNDLYRAIILLLLVAVLYLVDEANAVVFQALGIGILLAAGSQITRRILMPAIDMQEVAINAAKASPIAGAIVYAAMIVFLIAVMFLSVSILG